MCLRRSQFGILITSCGLRTAVRRLLTQRDWAFALPLNLLPGKLHRSEICARSCGNNILTWTSFQSGWIGTVKSSVGSPLMLKWPATAAHYSLQSFFKGKGSVLRRFRCFLIKCVSARQWQNRIKTHITIYSIPDRLSQRLKPSFWTVSPDNAQGSSDKQASMHVLCLRHVGNSSWMHDE